jgi:cell division protein FtsB
LAEIEAIYLKKSELEATIEALMQENKRLAADGISQAKEIERLNDMLSQKDTEISILKDRLVKYQRSECVGDDR